MRYYAVYDTDGNIATILGQPDHAPPLRPTGHQLTELAVPEGVIEPVDPGNLMTLLEIAANYRGGASTPPN
ncbi:hypothetical protein [Nocardia pneumoniae]|uniref:hypothetical protein n=1 Tax=Nocardia pneumoniae TaxID=228601 RepID=UPI00031E94E4|nr:hypothetical protein [Nocardia pneumoniae]